MALVVLVTVCACFFGLVASGAFRSPAPTICDAGSRTELLNARLDPWKPSPPFTLQSGATGWIQLTVLPASYEGLFGHIAGAAEVYSVHSGVQPNITTAANGDQEPHDPSITLDKAQTWQLLPMGPGRSCIPSATRA